MAQIRGKSAKALAWDIAEGFQYMNALFLKKCEPPDFKDLHQALQRTYRDILAEKFPVNNTDAIRRRNLRLQRLHQAIRVLENSAKEKKIRLV